MIKCKSANKYKGIYYPRCNKNNPCDACLKIYKDRQYKRGYKDAKQGHPPASSKEAYLNSYTSRLAFVDRYRW